MKEKNKFNFLWWNLGEILMILGVLFLFGYLAQFILLSHFLLAAVLFIIAGVIVKIVGFKAKH